MSPRLTRVFWKAGLLTTLLSLLGLTIALAASGDLDTTFSDDGKQHTDFSGSWGDRALAVALQSNGKIMVVGDRYDPAHPNAATGKVALARYNTNGSLDTTFTGDGKQLTDFGGADEARDVAIQADGKIVISGQKYSSSGYRLIVGRYNANGSLDTTFSGDGKQDVGPSTVENGSWGGLAIQSNGKIVVAGYVKNSIGNHDFAVYRLNANGTADTTFSQNGRVNIGFGAGRQDDVHDLALAGGRIVLAGETCDTAGTHCNFAVARLTSSGALDTTFSGDGKQTTDFGGDEHAEAIAIQSDGKIVVGGRNFLENANYMALARYNGNGTLDKTFSGDGRQTVANGPSSSVHDLLVQGNGKIVALGVASGARNTFGLVRLNTDGSLDTTFSGDGKLRVIFGGLNDIGEGLVQQTDGKYVLVGSVWLSVHSPQMDFGLARVLP